MNRIVRPPERRRACSASAMTSRISLMPDITALNAMKCARVALAMTRASVVLPVPGGPHRMIDRSRSCSIAARSGRPGPSSASWPTMSSMVRGRIRSASGAAGSTASGSAWRTGGSSSANRSIRPSPATAPGRDGGLLPLSRRLVEDERRGDRDVERFDRRLHRNRHRLVDRRHRRVRDAGPFAAEHDGRRLAEIELRQRRAAARDGGDEAHAELVGRGHHFRERSARRDRQPERAAHARRAAPSSRTDSPSLRSRRRPDAPNAAAARTIAPTLPGSCRPASTSTSGRSVTVAMTTRTSAGRARAIATTPDGVLHRAHRRQHLVGDDEDAAAALLDVLGDARDGREHVARAACRRTRRSRCGMSQRSASCTRCSPSSRTSVEWPARADGSASTLTGRAVRARSRKRLTIAFCRLLIRSIHAYYSVFFSATMPS